VTGTTDAPLTLTLETAGTTATIVVVGEIDMSTCDLLREEVEIAVARCERVNLDLGGVDFMDSTGIACLLGVRRQADNHGCLLRIVASSRPVEHVLTTAGVSDRLYG
jgi:anti-anti-sigma factor